MAIDTAEKRRSAAGFRRLPGVTPNASKDQEWRQQALRAYSGILAGLPGDAPLEGPPSAGGVLQFRQLVGVLTARRTTGELLER